MHVIKTLEDIRKLSDCQVISDQLAKHLEKKLKELREALEPDKELNQFSLAQHGPFGLMEKEDQNFTAMGLPKALDQIMPEWVSRVEVAGETYYVLYVMADNDYMVQVYLPDAFIGEALWLWLSEQSVEAEGGDEDVYDEAVPY